MSSNHKACAMQCMEELIVDEARLKDHRNLLGLHLDRVKDRRELLPEAEIAKPDVERYLTRRMEICNTLYLLRFGSQDDKERQRLTDQLEGLKNEIADIVSLEDFTLRLKDFGIGEEHKLHPTRFFVTPRATPGKAAAPARTLSKNRGGRPPDKATVAFYKIKERGVDVQPEVLCRHFDRNSVTLPKMLSADQTWQNAYKNHRQKVTEWIWEKTREYNGKHPNAPGNLGQP